MLISHFQVTSGFDSVCNGRFGTEGEYLRQNVNMNMYYSYPTTMYMYDSITTQIYVFLVTKMLFTTEVGLS